MASFYNKQFSSQIAIIMRSLIDLNFVCCFKGPLFYISVIRTTQSYCMEPYNNIANTETLSYVLESQQILCVHMCIKHTNRGKRLFLFNPLMFQVWYNCILPCTLVEITYHLPNQPDSNPFLQNIKRAIFCVSDESIWC